MAREKNRVGKYKGENKMVVVNPNIHSSILQTSLGAQMVKTLPAM